MTETIRDSMHAGVLTLTIDRPEKRNALTHAMTNSLREWLDRAEDDDTIRAVVITGEGDKAFCSGHDLLELRDEPEAAYDAAINEPFTQPRRISKPTIAAINGGALAGGLNLALSCDIRIAAASASFAATGARLGLLPIAGQMSVFPQLAGAGVALDVLLRSRQIDAIRAFQVGLVSEVVELPELIRTAQSIGENIAAAPAELNAVIKRAVWATVEAAGAEAARIECEEAPVFGRSDEARIRVAKFFNQHSN